MNKKPLIICLFLALAFILAVQVFQLTNKNPANYTENFPDNNLIADSFNDETTSSPTSFFPSLENLELPEHEDFFNEEEAPISSPFPTISLEKQEPFSVRVTAQFLENGGWKLEFDFPEAVSVRQIMDDNAIYLEFNQSVDTKDLTQIQQKLGYLIKQISSGFNSLYFVSERPAYFNTNVIDRIFILEIIPNYDVSIQETKSIRLAEARLYIEERHYQSAFQALSKLEEEYPDDKDLGVLYATLEGLQPRWQRQVQILNNLSNQYPLDEDIRQLLDEAYTPHAPYFSLERQLQRTIGLAAVQVYQLQTETFIQRSLSRALYVGSQAQIYRGHIKGIVNHNGNIVGFRGTRIRQNVYIRNEWESGRFVTASLYQQKYTFGLSLEYGALIPSIQGGFKILGCYHRPYWSIFETLVYAGREDLLKAEVASVYNRRISWQAEIGGHRVGIEGTPNGFTSVLAAGQVFYNFKIGNPTLSLNYALDAEYVTSIATKIGVNGKYNPVPYVSFENHSLRAYLFFIWRDRWNLNIYGGGTVNRIGGLAAPTYGVNLKYVKPVPCGWQLELSAYVFPSTIVQGATGEYYTATFLLNF